MASKRPYYLNAMGLCCALGNSKDAAAHSLFSDMTNAESFKRFLTHDTEFLHDGAGYYLGRVRGHLPKIPPRFAQYDSRNNQLLLLALQQIQEQVQAAIATYGAERVAVILGTSTSGIAEGEAALFFCHDTGAFPDDYYFGVQEISDGAEFLASYLGLQNLALTISTACSSSAKVFSHAAELLDAGLCDAVIVGGADSMCHLTVNGFHSLGALSDQPCNPFSHNRSGISIGEGGALFLMSAEPASVRLMSVGESSDGYSMTAPDPDGTGAEKSMRDALTKAGLKPEDIAYINLHGTATLHNDVMEAKAVARVFGPEIKCSSTKSVTGHTLGAAGAVEAALCWLMMSKTYNPSAKYLPQIWDGVAGADIELTNFAHIGERLPILDKHTYVLSNSFAFGGSNASVLLKYEAGHE